MRSRFVVAVLVSLAVLAAGARADLFVPGDFPTIQQAIDASAPGETIHVAPGTWTGPIVILDHGITIRGDGADLTIIDAAGARQVVLAGASSVVDLENFTLRGGADGVLTVGQGSIWLTNCVVRDNAGVGARGHVQVSGCTFADNGSHGLDGFDSLSSSTFFGNGGWGVVQYGAPFNTLKLETCSFLGNGLGGARLAVIGSNPSYPATISVSGCVFVNDNLQLSAVQGGGVGQSTVRHVTLLGGKVKLMQGVLTVVDSILLAPEPIVDLSASGDPSVMYSNLPGTWLPGTGNIDADPLFTDAASGDYTLLPGSPCINAGDPAVIADPDDSPADMGAFTYDPWTLLLVGPPGDLILWGGGALIAGKPVGLKLSSVPQQVLWVVLSPTELALPFKGSVLWPAPDILFPAVALPFGVQIALGYWPAGLPAGQTFVTQVWWPDASAPSGWLSTNGLRGTQP